MLLEEAQLSGHAHQILVRGVTKAMRYMIRAMAAADNVSMNTAVLNMIHRSLAERGYSVAPPKQIAYNAPNVASNDRVSAMRKARLVVNKNSIAARKKAKREAARAEYRKRRYGR